MSKIISFNKPYVGNEKEYRIRLEEFAKENDLAYYDVDAGLLGSSWMFAVGVMDIMGRPAIISIRYSAFKFGTDFNHYVETSIMIKTGEHSGTGCILREWSPSRNAIASKVLESGADPRILEPILIDQCKHRFYEELDRLAAQVGQEELPL